MNTNDAYITRGDSRSMSEEQAFREADLLLIAFGISAIPATLLLDFTGVDFLEGNFGTAGTTVMMLSGGTSLACAAIRLAARRSWAAGRSLEHVFAVMCWPLLLTLLAVWASLLAFAAESSFFQSTQ